jgi:nicotinamidase-related amidase
VNKDVNKQALLVIDMQNDFFVDDELERCREDLTKACNELIDRARQAGVPVLEVQTVHEHDKSTWALNMLEDDQGMSLKGSEGVQRVKGLRAGDVVIRKTRDSAFFGTDLEQRLRDGRVDRIVICGVSTESCIAATATDAYARDLRVTLVEDGTASIEWAQHDQTLERLKEQYRQDVLRAADISFSSSVGA